MILNIWYSILLFFIQNSASVFSIQYKKRIQIFIVKSFQLSSVQNPGNGHLLVSNHKVTRSLFNKGTCFWLTWSGSSSSSALLWGPWNAYILKKIYWSFISHAFTLFNLQSALTRSVPALHFSSRCDLLNGTSQCLLNVKWFHFLVPTIISPTPTSERPLPKIKKAPCDKRHSLASAFINCFWEFSGQNVEERKYNYFWQTAFSKKPFISYVSLLLVA